MAARVVPRSKLGSFPGSIQVRPCDRLAKPIWLGYAGQARHRCGAYAPGAPPRVWLIPALDDLPAGISSRVVVPGSHFRTDRQCPTWGGPLADYVARCRYWRRRELIDAFTPCREQGSLVPDDGMELCRNGQAGG